MVSLCLTKPHIDGRVSAVSNYSDNGNALARLNSNDGTLTGKTQFATAKKNVNDNDSTNLRSEETVKALSLNQTFFKRKSTDSINSTKGISTVDSKIRYSSLPPQKREEKLIFYREESIDSQRSKMLATVQAMGGSRNNRRTSSRNRRRFSRQYSQHIPDASKDRYSVHKWRLKSGRVLETNQFTKRQAIQTQQKLQKMKHLREVNLKVKQPENLFHNVESRYLLKTVQTDSALKGKEELFGIGSGKTYAMNQGRGAKSISYLPRLRNQLRNWENLHLSTSEVERFSDAKLTQATSESGDWVANFNAMRVGEKIEHLLNFPQKRRASVTLASRNDVLPPIVPPQRRQSYPMRQQSHREYKTGTQNKRKVSLIHPVASPMAIPEHAILNSSSGFLQKRDSYQEVSGRNDKSDHDNMQYAKVFGGSPVHKKSHSSMTMQSLSTTRSGSKEGKDGDTPTDSEGSLGASKYKRSKKRRGSRMLTKMESRNSPQFRLYVKPRRMDALMRQWYICTKLAIWLSRLYKSHRMMVDDSYNIRSGSNASEENVGSDFKKEVLFDVTDYKMKNQLRLSETTRRVLLLPSNKRTEKDLNLVQTALRNIKAIADYSNIVQKQIGRHGYFVGFEGKRVVVKESKQPLNYYLLLAGSAVVIKSDDEGNTNPVLFMKRGDIFGEKEILEDMKWQWSVASSGYCEFLLLDREDYKKIFITGGRGGLLSDPDRGGFLRSVQLLHHWPITLLGDNPNRCLFRYFKRGALLVSDSNLSEWIYIVKSGSCSVLKQLQVESLSEAEILLRVKKEQKFRSKISANPRLVEETEPIEKEDHVSRLMEKEEAEKNKEISVFQQLEMSSILKELNPDLIGTTVSPRAEAGFEDFRSEFPMSSYKGETTEKMVKQDSQKKGKINEKKYAEDENLDEFRLSRHSDHLPPRTPSPTKAAYLQTGLSTGSAKRESDSRMQQVDQKCDGPPEIIVTDVQQPEKTPKKLISAQKQVRINEFLFGANSPDDMDEEEPDEEHLEPVHINVRVLTKQDVFGIEPHLYSNQPSLILVSNGAECLMLNKKFYLDNANEDCMKFLRESGYPYPSDSELEEQHWRLATWKAYQASVMRELLQRE